jgi:2-dehydro-3-deoxygluconokinase
MRPLAAIGECMLELSEHPDGRITRAFGGDTLNTAVYLARLGVPVDYITALGDDPWSEEMLAAWQAEGVGTASVLRLEGRLPGLYIIQTDERAMDTSTSPAFRFRFTTMRVEPCWLTL